MGSLVQLVHITFRFAPITGWCRLAAEQAQETLPAQLSTPSLRGTTATKQSMSPQGVLWNLRAVRNDDWA